MAGPRCHGYWMLTPASASPSLTEARTCDCHASFGCRAEVRKVTSSLARMEPSISRVGQDDRCTKRIWLPAFGVKRRGEFAERSQGAEVNLTAVGNGN